MSQVLRMRNQTSLSRTRGFAGAMIQQTLQTCLCPCGDAELDQTARAIIGNKIRRSLEIAWQAKLRPSRLAWLRLSAGAQGEACYSPCRARRLKTAVSSHCSRSRLYSSANLPASSIDARPFDRGGVACEHKQHAALRDL
jgi:hypothetical protein